MSSETAEPDAKKGIDGRIGVLMVGMAVVVWWPAFTLGAWGTLFFDQLLTLWAAATAAFVYVLVERRPVGTRLLRAFLLLLPTLWLILTLVVPEDTDDVVVFVVDAVAIVSVLLGIPFTTWVLVRIMWPDLGGETPARLRWLTLFVVFGVAAASFLIGVNQSRFLSCEDFTISGNSEPPGCVHESP